MRNKIDPEIMEQMITGSVSTRKYIVERLPEYFMFYYFPEYCTYALAPFHWQFFDDFDKLMKGVYDEGAWIAFRESAKTTIAKVMVTRAICLKLKKYINWDSYDKENAEAALFDIATWLSTNQRLIADYGHLYKKKKKKAKSVDTSGDDPSLKRINNFITENGIKVAAFSTQESTRGRIIGKERPDFFVLDDIETSKTAESFAVIGSIKKHVDEMRAGLGVTGSILVLGNYLTEEGVIAYIEELLKDKSGKFYRKIPVLVGNEVTWPGKYVNTRHEAWLVNQDLPRDQWKVSIEKKREDLTEPVFQKEMMNNPGASGDYYFDRNIIRGLIQKCEAAQYEPVSQKGGFRLFQNYDTRHRYVLGADTAEGIGGDHNASALINLSTTPNRLMGTYKNNEEGPNVFGYTLKRQGEQFGGCFLMPELNNTGYGTIATLIAEKYYNMYVREVKNKTTDKIQKEFGYKTHDGNKSEVLDNFRSAVQDGVLEIMDIELLQECYHYTKAHLRLRRKEEGMTRHFDLLMAAALAWEGRTYATKSAEEKKSLYTAPKARPM